MNPKDRMKRRKNKTKKKFFTKKLLMGGIFVGLMVFSVFAIIFSGFSNGTNENEYNGHKFYTVQNGFSTKIDGKDVVFTHLPQQVENINISQQLIDRIKNTLEIDITTSLNTSIPQEIAISMFYFKSTIESTSQIFVREGFTEENEYNITKITCSDATPHIPVIVYEYSNTTEIEDKGSCTILHATSGDEFNRLTSRVLYAFLGII